MSQAPGAVEFWEKFLFKNNFARIIEFGTYKGALSLFFLLWCRQRGAYFYTYDNMAHKRSKLAYWLKFEQHFQKWDIFEHELEIGELIQSSGVTIVFCDNGNKPLELKVFSKYLKSGDFIVSHDWGTEVQGDDIPSDLEIVDIHDATPSTIILKKP